MNRVGGGGNILEWRHRRASAEPKVKKSYLELGNSFIASTEADQCKK